LRSTLFLKFSRFSVATAAFIFLIITLLPISSIAATEAPDINASSFILYNLEYEKVLYSENASERISPSALTKLMTALLAFEYWEEHSRLVPAVVVSEMVVTRSGGTNISLKEGEVISYSDLLHAMVIHGANDAANAIAETVGGSIDSFIEMMTERARELGCQDTYFDNTTGIHSSLMYTTLEDMLKICKALYRHDEFMRIASKLKYTIPATNRSKQRELVNRNYVVNPDPALGYYVKGAQGMCAGFTAQAGYCAAAAMEDSGLTNIAIISGATMVNNVYEHFRDIKKLLNYGKNAFHEKTVLEKSKVITELPVRFGNDMDHTTLITADSAEILVSDDFSAEDITTEVRLDRDILIAPVKPGEVCGKVDIYYKGEIRAQVDIITNNAITRNIILYAFDGVKNFLLNDTMRLIFSVIAIILLLFFIILLTAMIIQTVRKELSVKEAVKADKQAYNDQLKQRRSEEKYRIKLKRAKRTEKLQTVARNVRSVYREAKKNMEDREIEAQEKKRDAIYNKRRAELKRAEVKGAKTSSRPTSSSTKSASPQKSQGTRKPSQASRKQSSQGGQKRSGTKASSSGKQTVVKRRPSEVNVRTYTGEDMHRIPVTPVIDEPPVLKEEPMEKKKKKISFDEDGNINI